MWCGVATGKQPRIVVMVGGGCGGDIGLNTCRHHIYPSADSNKTLARAHQPRINNRKRPRQSSPTTKSPKQDQKHRHQNTSDEKTTHHETEQQTGVEAVS
jgi:hypothetical protein